MLRVMLLLLWTLVSCSESTIETRLINGTPANPSDFPASVLLRSYVGNCTGTVIGERTVLFAAHCNANNGLTYFTAGGANYSCRVVHSPRQPFGHDMALCYTDRPVTGIPYESVNLDPSFVQVGDVLMLSGYGCIYPGGTGGNDGVYRVGNVRVNYLADEARNNFDMVSISNVALCYGDSGGPAFKWVGSSRFVVGVNSKSDMRTTSYVTTTSTRASQEFLMGWARTQEICGISDTAQNCRG